MGRLVLLVVVDIAVIAGLSIAVGAWAPRWPDSWLRRDTFPLTRFRWETPAFFRQLRVPALARRLPELGSTFGGQGKDQLPGRTAHDLCAYLVEVRRGEWVHWLSIASALLLFAVNPWWLAVAFLVAASIGNLPFLLVLRNNRFRIQRILSRRDG